MDQVLGTTITLAYCDNSKGKRTKDLISMLEAIEADYPEDEDLKLYANTSYSRSGRIQHQILVNKKIDSTIKNEWRNGHVSIEYIINADRYKEVAKCFMD